MSEKTIAIIGPTASGKTELSIKIANLFNKNIVNSDSRQFWPLESLSCSPTKAEKQRAPHLLFNCIPFDFIPNLGWWCTEISKINQKVLVGGNGFYINSLQKGVPLVQISQETKKKVEGLENRFEFLKILDQDCKLHANDTYRINRKLEFMIETGQGFENYPQKYTEKLLVILLQPDIKTLEANINQRTNKIIDEAIEEISRLLLHPSLQTIIGYSEVVDFLNKKISKDSLIKQINEKTLKYAKHQIKFFKNMSVDFLYDTIENVPFEIFKNLS